MNQNELLLLLLLRNVSNLKFQFEFKGINYDTKRNWHKLAMPCQQQ